MNNIQSEEVLHQVYFERYKTNEAIKLLSILDKANREIAERIKRVNGIYTKKRYRELAKFLKEKTQEVKDLMKGEIDIDGTIEEEIEAQVKIVNSIIKGVKDVTTPSPAQVKETVTFKPAVGKTFEEFLENTQTGLYQTWDSALRTGFLTGMTTPEIVKSVLGSVDGRSNYLSVGKMSSLRNSVMANTRTQLQSMGNEIRSQMFQQNHDLFDGYQWLATLDRRTCLVCSNLDGKLFTSQKDIPEMPMHMSCRCLIVPHFKDDDFNMVGERASEFGTVKGNTDYETWFERQTETVKRDILGEGRYKLYKENDQFTLGDFISGNRILSLSELRAKL